MKKSFKISAAIFTLTTFVFTQFNTVPNVYAAAQMPISEIQVGTAGNIALPSNLGTIEALNLQGQGPMIAHIQTAHGNFEAQKNIQGILEFLKDKHGFNTLLLEGSAYPLNPEIIRFFPDDMKLTHAIAEDLTRKALFKGADLFMIDNPKVKALGIEDVDLYRENGNAFRAVLRQEAATENFVRDMNIQIERLTSPYMNKDLRAFLNRLDAYESKQVQFQDWVNTLKAEASKQLALDLEDPANQLEWPMLLRLFTLMKFEAKLDPAALDKEKAAFLKAIHRLPKNVYAQIEKLLTQPVNRNQLPSPETELLFEKMVQSLPSNFNYKAFPNVSLFIGHLIFQSEIKALPLMSEVSSLEDKIAERLAITKEEKQILGLLKDHRLLNRLFALQLTPNDYEEVLARGNDMKPAQVAARFEKLNASKRVKNVKFTNIEKINELYAKSIEFYRLVKARDLAMLKNVPARMKKAGVEKAVVITGGFHSEPFREFAQAEGFQYALISPKITTDKGHDAYVRAVLATELKDLSRNTYETVFVGVDSPELLRNQGVSPEVVVRAVAASAKGLKVPVSRFAGTRLAQVLGGRKANITGSSTTVELAPGVTATVGKLAPSTSLGAATSRSEARSTSSGQSDSGEGLSLPKSEVRAEFKEFFTNIFLSKSPSNPTLDMRLMAAIGLKDEIEYKDKIMDFARSVFYAKSPSNPTYKMQLLAGLILLKDINEKDKILKYASSVFEGKSPSNPTYDMRLLAGLILLNDPDKIESVQKFAANVYEGKSPSNLTYDMRLLAGLILLNDPNRIESVQKFSAGIFSSKNPPNPTYDMRLLAALILSGVGSEARAEARSFQSGDEYLDLTGWTETELLAKLRGLHSERERLEKEYDNANRLPAGPVFLYQVFTGASEAKEIRGELASVNAEIRNFNRMLDLMRSRSEVRATKKTAFWFGVSAAALAVGIGFLAIDGLRRPSPKDRGVVKNVEPADGKLPSKQAPIILGNAEFSGAVAIYQEGATVVIVDPKIPSASAVITPVNPPGGKITHSTIGPARLIGEKPFREIETIAQIGASVPKSNDKIQVIYHPILKGGYTTLQQLRADGKDVNGAINVVSNSFGFQHAFGITATYPDKEAVLKANPGAKIRYEGSILETGARVLVLDMRVSFKLFVAPPVGSGSDEMLEVNTDPNESGQDRAGNLRMVVSAGKKETTFEFLAPRPGQRPTEPTMKYSLNGNPVSTFTLISFVRPRSEVRTDLTAASLSAFIETLNFGRDSLAAKIIMRKDAVNPKKFTIEFSSTSTYGKDLPPFGRSAVRITTQHNIWEAMDKLKWNLPKQFPGYQSTSSSNDDIHFFLAAPRGLKEAAKVSINNKEVNAAIEPIRLEDLSYGPESWSHLLFEWPDSRKGMAGYSIYEDGRLFKDGFHLVEGSEIDENDLPKEIAPVRDAYLKNPAEEWLKVTVGKRVYIVSPEGKAYQLITPKQNSYTYINPTPVNFRRLEVKKDSTVLAGSKSFDFATSTGVISQGRFGWTWMAYALDLNDRATFNAYRSLTEDLGSIGTSEAQPFILRAQQKGSTQIDSYFVYGEPSAMRFISLGAAADESFAMDYLGSIALQTQAIATMPQITSFDGAIIPIDGNHFSLRLRSEARNAEVRGKVFLNGEGSGLEAPLKGEQPISEVLETLFPNQDILSKIKNVEIIGGAKDVPVYGDLTKSTVNLAYRGLRLATLQIQDVLAGLELIRDNFDRTIKAPEMSPLQISIRNLKRPEPNEANFNSAARLLHRLRVEHRGIDDAFTKMVNNSSNNQPQTPDVSFVSSVNRSEVRTAESLSPGEDLSQNKNALWFKLMQDKVLGTIMLNGLTLEQVQINLKDPVTMDNFLKFLKTGADEKSLSPVFERVFKAFDKGKMYTAEYDFPSLVLVYKIGKEGEEPKLLDVPAITIYQPESHRYHFMLLSPRPVMDDHDFIDHYFNLALAKGLVPMINHVSGVGYEADYSIKDFSLGFDEEKGGLHAYILPARSEARAGHNILLSPVTDLTKKWKPAAKSIFEELQILTVAQLVQYTMTDLSGTNSSKRDGLKQIKAALDKHGLKLRGNVSETARIPLSYRMSSILYGRYPFLLSDATKEKIIQKTTEAYDGIEPEVSDFLHFSWSDFPYLNSEELKELQRGLAEQGIALGYLGGSVHAHKAQIQLNRKQGVVLDAKGPNPMRIMVGTMKLKSPRKPTAVTLWVKEGDQDWQSVDLQLNEKRKIGNRSVDLVWLSSENQVALEFSGEVKTIDWETKNKLKRLSEAPVRRSEIRALFSEISSNDETAIWISGIFVGVLAVSKLTYELVPMIWHKVAPVEYDFYWYRDNFESLVEQLAKESKESVVPELIAKTQGDNPFERLAAYAALVRRGEKQYVPGFLNSLFHDTEQDSLDQKKAFEIFRQYSELKADERFDAISKILEADPDGAVRSQALKILQRTASFTEINEKKAALIVGRLSDSSEDVRVQALNISRYRKLNVDKSLLISNLQHESAKVRLEAARAVTALMSREEAVQVLKQALLFPGVSNAEKISLVQLLADLGDKSGADLLASIIVSDDKNRDSAWEVLIEIGNAAHLKQIALGLRRSSEEIRKKTLQKMIALGATPDLLASAYFEILLLPHFDNSDMKILAEAISGLTRSQEKDTLSLIEFTSSRRNYYETVLIASARLLESKASDSYAQYGDDIRGNVLTAMRQLSSAVKNDPEFQSKTIKVLENFLAKVPHTYEHETYDESDAYANWGHSGIVTTENLENPVYRQALDLKASIEQALSSPRSEVRSRAIDKDLLIINVDRLTGMEKGIIRAIISGNNKEIPSVETGGALTQQEVESFLSQIQKRKGGLDRVKWFDEKFSDHILNLSLSDEAKIEWRRAFYLFQNKILHSAGEIPSIKMEIVKTKVEDPYMVYRLRTSETDGIYFHSEDLDPSKTLFLNRNSWTLQGFNSDLDIVINVSGISPEFQAASLDSPGPLAIGSGFEVKMDPDLENGFLEIRIKLSDANQLGSVFKLTIVPEASTKTLSPMDGPALRSEVRITSGLEATEHILAATAKLTDPAFRQIAFDLRQVTHLLNEGKSVDAENVIREVEVRLAGYTKENPELYGAAQKALDDLRKVRSETRVLTTGEFDFLLGDLRQVRDLLITDRIRKKERAWRELLVKPRLYTNEKKQPEAGAKNIAEVSNLISELEGYQDKVTDIPGRLIDNARKLISDAQGLKFEPGYERIIAKLYEVEEALMENLFYGGPQDLDLVNKTRLIHDFENSSRGYALHTREYYSPLVILKDFPTKWTERMRSLEEKRGGYRYYSPEKMAPAEALVEDRIKTVFRDLAGLANFRALDWTMWLAKERFERHVGYDAAWQELMEKQGWDRESPYESMAYTLLSGNDDLNEQKIDPTSKEWLEATFDLKNYPKRRKNIVDVLNKYLLASVEVKRGESIAEMQAHFDGDVARFEKIANALNLSLDQENLSKAHDRFEEVKARVQQDLEDFESAKKNKEELIERWHAEEIRKAVDYETQGRARSSWMESHERDLARFSSDVNSKLSLSGVLALIELIGKGLAVASYPQQDIDRYNKIVKDNDPLTKFAVSPNDTLFNFLNRTTIFENDAILIRIDQEATPHDISDFNERPEPETNYHLRIRIIPKSPSVQKNLNELTKLSFQLAEKDTGEEHSLRFRWAESTGGYDRPALEVDWTSGFDDAVKNYEFRLPKEWNEFVVWRLSQSISPVTSLTPSDADPILEGLEKLLSQFPNSPYAMVFAPLLEVLKIKSTSRSEVRADQDAFLKVVGKVDTVGRSWNVEVSREIEPISLDDLKAAIANLFNNVNERNISAIVHTPSLGKSAPLKAQDNIALTAGDLLTVSLNIPATKRSEVRVDLGTVRDMATQMGFKPKAHELLEQHHQDFSAGLPVISKEAGVKHLIYSSDQTLKDAEGRNYGIRISSKGNVLIYIQDRDKPFRFDSINFLDIQYDAETQTYKAIVGDKAFLTQGLDSQVSYRVHLSQGAPEVKVRFWKDSDLKRHDTKAEQAAIQGYKDRIVEDWRAQWSPQETPPDFRSEVRAVPLVIMDTEKLTQALVQLAKRNATPAEIEAALAAIKSESKSAKDYFVPMNVVLAGVIAQAGDQTDTVNLNFSNQKGYLDKYFGEMVVAIKSLLERSEEARYQNINGELKAIISNFFVAVVAALKWDTLAVSKAGREVMANVLDLTEEITAHALILYANISFRKGYEKETAELRGVIQKMVASLRFLVSEELFDGDTNLRALQIAAQIENSFNFAQFDFSENLGIDGLTFNLAVAKDFTIGTTDLFAAVAGFLGTKQANVQQVLHTDSKLETNPVRLTSGYLTLTPGDLLTVSLKKSIAPRSEARVDETLIPRHFTWRANRNWGTHANGIGMVQRKIAEGQLKDIFVFGKRISTADNPLAVNQLVDMIAESSKDKPTPEYSRIWLPGYKALFIEQTYSFSPAAVNFLIEESRKTKDLFNYLLSQRDNQRGLMPSQVTSETLTQINKLSAALYEIEKRAATQPFELTSNDREVIFKSLQLVNDKNLTTRSEVRMQAGDDPAVDVTVVYPKDTKWEKVFKANGVAHKSQIVLTRENEKIEIAAFKHHGEIYAKVGNAIYQLIKQKDGKFELNLNELNGVSNPALASFLKVPFSAATLNQFEVFLPTDDSRPSEKARLYIVSPGQQPFLRSKIALDENVRLAYQQELIGIIGDEETFDSQKIADLRANPAQLSRLLHLAATLGVFYNDDTDYLRIKMGILAELVKAFQGDPKQRLISSVFNLVYLSHTGMNWDKWLAEKAAILAAPTTATTGPAVKERKKAFFEIIDPARVPGGKVEDYEITGVRVLSADEVSGRKDPEAEEIGLAAIIAGRIGALPFAGGSATSVVKVLRGEIDKIKDEIIKKAQAEGVDPEKLVYSLNKMVHPALHVKTSTGEELNISILEYRVLALLGQSLKTPVTIVTSDTPFASESLGETAKLMVNKLDKLGLPAGQISKVTQRNGGLLDNQGNLVRFDDGTIAVAAENHLWAFNAWLQDKKSVIDHLKRTDGILLIGNGDNGENTHNPEIVGKILQARKTGRPLLTVAGGVKSQKDTKGGVYTEVTYRNIRTGETFTKLELREVNEFPTLIKDRPDLPQYDGIDFREEKKSNSPAYQKALALGAFIEKQMLDDKEQDRGGLFNPAFYGLDTYLGLSRIFNLPYDPEHPEKLVEALAGIDDQKWVDTLNEFSKRVPRTTVPDKGITNEVTGQTVKGKMFEQAVQNLIFVSALFDAPGQPAVEMDVVTIPLEKFLAYKGTSKDGVYDLVGVQATYQAAIASGKTVLPLGNGQKVVEIVPMDLKQIVWAIVDESIADAKSRSEVRANVLPLRANDKFTVFGVSFIFKEIFSRQGEPTAKFTFKPVNAKWVVSSQYYEHTFVDVDLASRKLTNRRSLPMLRADGEEIYVLDQNHQGHRIRIQNVDLVNNTVEVQVDQEVQDLRALTRSEVRQVPKVQTPEIAQPALTVIQVFLAGILPFRLFDQFMSAGLATATAAVSFVLGRPVIAAEAAQSQNENEDAIDTRLRSAARITIGAPARESFIEASDLPAAQTATAETSGKVFLQYAAFESMGKNPQAMRLLLEGFYDAMFPANKPVLSVVLPAEVSVEQAKTSLAAVIGNKKAGVTDALAIKNLQSAIEFISLKPGQTEAGIVNDATQQYEGAVSYLGAGDIVDLNTPAVFGFDLAQLSRRPSFYAGAALVALSLNRLNKEIRGKNLTPQIRAQKLNEFVAKSLDNAVERKGNVFILSLARIIQNFLASRYIETMA